MKIDKADVFPLGDAYVLKLYTKDVQTISKISGTFKPGEYELKRIDDKRSNQANRYLWRLCNDIAEKTQITKEDVYKNAVRRVGIYKDFDALPISQAKTLQTAWERLGTGWVTEQVDFDTDGENVIIRCYYGSSTYSKKQMSRLLQDVISDAESLGIETLDSQRLDSLLEEYDEHK